MERSRLIRNIFRWRVRSAMLIAALSTLFAKPSKTSLILGGCISLAGLAIRAWASAHLQKEQELAVSGPYRFTRNPLYFGSFILGISFAIGANAFWPAVIFGVYFLIFYPVVILVEKERMEKYFPRQYREYKKHVPLFLPCLKSKSEKETTPFSFHLYMRNKEFRALIGTAVFWTILLIKFVLVP
jgi:protein-S-isoprenylcysteine O-methyltransferase Ste14